MKKKAAKAAGTAPVRRPRSHVGGRITRIGDILTLSVSQRAAVIATMTPLECAQIFHDWNFWARPDQAPPPGDWVVWLILAGRGAGKTRAGAEAVRHWTRDYPIVNLIGPTANDVRDTMGSAIREFSPAAGGTKGRAFSTPPRGSNGRTARSRSSFRPRSPTGSEASST